MGEKKTRRFRVFYPVEPRCGITKSNVIDVDDEELAKAIFESTYPRGSFMVDESLGYWFDQMHGFAEVWKDFVETSPEFHRLLKDIDPKMTEKQERILKNATAKTIEDMVKESK